ncbi:hypothetical protein Tco_0578215 [Tanacetum coccineum]
MKVAKRNSKDEDTTKVPAKVDVTEQGTKKRKGGHMKMIARKRKRPQPDVDSDDEHRKCLKIVTFEGTIDSEIMEKKSFISKLDKVSSPEGDYLVIHRANGNFRAFNYLLEIITLEDCELILLGTFNDIDGSSTESKMIKVISGVINKIGRLSLGDCILFQGFIAKMLDLILEVESKFVDGGSLPKDYKANLVGCCCNEVAVEDMLQKDRRCQKIIKDHIKMG